MLASEGRIQQLRVEPMRRSAPAATASRLYGIAMNRTARVAHLLLHATVKPLADAPGAVAQVRAEVALSDADACAHCTLRDAEQTSEAWYVDISGLDPVVGSTPWGPRWVTTACPGSAFMRANFHSIPTMDSYGCSQQRWKM